MSTFGMHSLTTVPSRAAASKQSLATAPSAPYEQCPAACPYGQKTLVCWSPRHSSGVVSCTLEKGGDPLLFIRDPRCAIIPEGAIIDSIEFFGVDGFSTKDSFSIGLGMMNTGIQLPLIVGADPGMANEKIGGCREFSSTNSDGRNDKKMAVTNSFINLDFGQPVTSGLLQVVVRYHLKIV